MQDPNAIPAHEQDGENEVSLLAIFRAVWRIRVWIVAGGLLALILTIATVLALRVVDYQTEVQYVVEFRFDGRTENRYPNGTPFSLGDIVAPSILAQVFEQEKLGNYGLTLRDFQSAVSISPYTPERKFILDTYYQSIDPKKATVAELREAQDALTRELDTASKRYAVLTFTQSGFAIPTADISRILTRIVQAWENTAITTRGVLKQDIVSVDPNVFDVKNIKDLEKLSGVIYISKNLVSLRDYLKEISELPGGNLVRDAQTGFNVYSLIQLVSRSATQLAQLPTDWAGNTTDIQTEALGLPIGLYSDQLFDPKQLDNLDYLIGIDLLRDRIKLIRDNLDELHAAPSGDLAVDPETKLAARDISRLLSDVENIDIKEMTAPILSLGIAKNPVAIGIYYNSQLQELKRSKDNLAAKARVLEQANQAYQSSAGTGVTAQPNQDGSPIVVPQFGDGFLDRIIALAQKGENGQFRQDLVQKAIRLQQDATDLDEEIARISEYIKVFPDTSATPPENTDLRNSFTKKIEAGLPQIMNKLKTYAAVTQRIALRLKLAQDIYTVATVDNPNSGAPRIGVDFYLRNVNSGSILSMPALLDQLKGYAEAANRMYDKISTDTLGTYMKLFRAASEPQQIDPPLITRFELLLMLLGTLLGAILGLVAGLVNTMGARSSEEALAH